MRERTDLRASCLSPTATWFHPRGRAGLRCTREPLGQPCVVQFSSFTPHAMEPIWAGRCLLSARREYRGRPTLGAPRTLPTHTPASKPFRASASPFPPAVANRLLLRPRQRRVVSPMAFKSASFNRIFQRTLEGRHRSHELMPSHARVSPCIIGRHGWNLHELGHWGVDVPCRAPHA